MHQLFAGCNHQSKTLLKALIICMNVICSAARCSNDPPRASHWGKLVLLLILLQGKAFRAAFLCFPLLFFLLLFGPLIAAASCFHHSEQELQILVELENRLETLLSGGWKRNVSDGAVAQEAPEIFCNCVRKNMERLEWRSGPVFMRVASSAAIHVTRKYQFQYLNAGRAAFWFLSKRVE